MKNWKTTLAGAVPAVGYAVIAAVQAGNINYKDLLIVAGLALLGYFAKDKNVTGGTVNQAVTPATPAK